MVKKATKKSAKGVKTATKYKKAPDAPKRFKSAFIIFSAEKHKTIKKKLEDEGRPEKTTDIAKLVSEAWKALVPEDREEWELKAEADRARYEEEKANYKGPWKIPAHNKRSTKDPSAPKRPMSAFLAYSNSRRAGLKRLNPKATNSDLSKMLSKSWKELDGEERAKYMEEEAGKRNQYKIDMAVWRKKAAKQKKLERVEEEERAAAEPQQPDPGPAMNAQMQQQQMLEQMQMQQQQDFMANNGGMGGMDPMGMTDQQTLMQQQMAAQGGGDANGSDGQQNMNGGLFGGGQNPYALQAGLGGMGFPGGMGAFGLNSASNPYLANAFMQGGGQGGLSALMGQNYMNNQAMMGQLPQQMQSMNPMQQQMSQMQHGLYGQNLGGYGGLGGGAGNGAGIGGNSNNGGGGNGGGNTFES